MKKILYIIGFLMFFSSVVKPLAALGLEKSQFSGKEEDVPFSASRIFSNVLEKTGLEPSNDWGVVFGTDNEEDVGKNLYLTIYKKTQEEPEKKAFKNTAGKFGLTEAEMVRLSQGDYSPIVDKKKGLSQEEAQQKMAEIQQNLKEEKELLSLEADIKAGVEPNEIFANGDLGDSGFDLINDLQNIEKILFKKSDPIDVGGSFDSDDDNSQFSPPEPGQPGEKQDQPKDNGGVINPDSPKDQGDNQNDKNKPDNSGVENGEDNQSGNKEDLQNPVDPNKCFTDKTFDKAFDAFNQKVKSDPNYKDISAVQMKNNSEKVVIPGLDKNKNGNSGPAQSEVIANDDFLPEKIPPEKPPVQPAPADQWQKPKDCDGPFCLKVEFVKKPVQSAFQNSDNCIACMVEKINDTLKKVVNHSLIPAKAPGNLGESATCKKGVADVFGAVSMNFYAVTMPIKTPINDDLIFGTSAADDWYNFCKTVSLYPFNECKKPAKTLEESKYEIPPSVTDAVTKREISLAKDDVDQAQLTHDIQIAVNAYKINSAKESDKLQVSKESEKKIVMFHPLLTEMDLMNFYFLNFSQILQSLHEDVTGVPGSHACTVLKNKKQCE